MPAATVSTTAQDLTRFYQMLLRGGEVDGVRVLRPETVAQATAPSANGETDRLLRLPVRWSQGFQLGGPAPDPRRPRPMGAASSPDAFGHNGSNCCLAWADPSRALVFAYLTNRLSTSFDGLPPPKRSQRRHPHRLPLSGPLPASWPLPVGGAV